MKVRHTTPAARQLEAVLDYLEARSPRRAQHVISRIEAAIDLLTTQPLSGRFIGKHDLRRIVANPYPYLIFYRATPGEIVIHGIRHAARKPRR